ncbi:hypothetical protein DL98DRAFT_491371 [Cadophora sp. DSE1049]|nr:hypothetical protein DL98DRAFT_491371 [Cadophora sp. DSE1049]
MLGGYHEAKPTRIYTRAPFLLIAIATACILLAFGFPENPTPKTFLLSLDGTKSKCPLIHNVQDKCAFIRANCEDESPGLLSYLSLYYCRLPHAKPLALIVLVSWLALLFMTISILMLDFLLVNLSTIEHGLPNSLQIISSHGFGYAIPHILASFAAVDANSPSLAIGELFGAAIFIIAFVGGSIAIQGEFRLMKHGFVHVSMFMVGTAGFGLVIMVNGRLYTWQCLFLLSIYALFVLSVVLSKWYVARRRRRREREIAARSHYLIPGDEYYDDPEDFYHDDEDDENDPDLVRPPKTKDKVGSSHLRRYSNDPIKVESGPSRVDDRNGLPRPSPGLRPQGVLADFAITKNPPESSETESLFSLEDEYDRLRLDPSALHKGVIPEPDVPGPRSNLFGPLFTLFESRARREGQDSAPQLLFADEGTEADVTPSQTIQQDNIQNFPLILQAHLPQNIEFPVPSLAGIARTVFPVFQGWESKDTSDKIMTVISTPSVFIATLTVPVVEYVEEDEDEDIDTTFGEFGIPVPSDVGQPSKRWNRSLTIFHVFTSPYFVLLFVWFKATSRSLHVLLQASLITLSISFVGAGLVLTTTTAYRPLKWRVLLSYMGLAVNVLWFLTLASEVVGVLKTLSIIFGIPDAILGLTIFAVGNSFGTLFMGINIAKLGHPALSYASNYGASLQSILLGMGLSASWAVWKRSQDSSVQFGLVSSYILLDKMLWIPCLMLLSLTMGLLLVVPCKGWTMGRSFGWCLNLMWTIGILASTFFAR